MWISGSRVFKSCAARKRFPAVELPSNIQRVGVPIRRATRTRPEIVPHGGRFPVSNVHTANESALRLDEPARLYSETAPRGSVFPPSSFRRTSNASACRFGGRRVRVRRSCRTEGASRFQMSIQQTSRLSGWTSRLVCTQRLRRAEAFSRYRASVDRPTRRRSDSEGRRARRLCRAEGVFRFQISI